MLGPQTPSSRPSCCFQSWMTVIDISLGACSYLVWVTWGQSVLSHPLFFFPQRLRREGRPGSASIQESPGKGGL